MLNFSDAYNLASANEYKFTLPTQINELNINGTINNNQEIIARLGFNENASLKLVNETLLQGEILLFFKTKIDAKNIEEFKEYYNSFTKSLLEIDVEQHGFTLIEQDKNEDFDFNFSFSY